MSGLAKVNAEGRETASRILRELTLLREAVATHLRYIDGEVVSGLRAGRHTKEVAANIAEHQSRNLRAALERTGAPRADGTLGPGVTIPAADHQRDRD